MLNENAIRQARARLSQTTVLLLAGGWSSERRSSLDTAMHLMPLLSNLCKEVTLLDPLDIPALLKACHTADFALNVLYGRYGEDGAIQGFLSIVGLPTSGSGVLASAVGMNKDVFLSLLRDWGYRVPDGFLVSRVDELGLSRLFRQGQGYILKPIDEGDSLGVQFMREKAPLLRAIAAIQHEDRERWRIEEFVEGPFGTVGVVNTVDGIAVGDPIIFNLPAGKNFYDTDLKLGRCGKPTVSFVDGDARILIQRQAADIYTRLGCNGAARLDFIINGNEPVYLEINTIPGLYPGSNLDLSFAAHIAFENLLAVMIHAQLASDDVDSEYHHDETSHA
ncbi:ATP-grasp domain-containing protein [Alcaligenaceae bacterium A4P071]|nr:ATP-grasp domain-containing protein [Alcaligenaceae bacterium A4P071]